jgi:hypothetical protein
MMGVIMNLKQIEKLCKERRNAKTGYNYTTGLFRPHTVKLADQVPSLIAKLREARAHILRAKQICKTIGYPYHATDERDFDRFLSTVTDEEVKPRSNTSNIDG